MYFDHTLQIKCRCQLSSSRSTSAKQQHSSPSSSAAIEQASLALAASMLPLAATLPAFADEAETGARAAVFNWIGSGILSSCGIWSVQSLPWKDQPQSQAWRRYFHRCCSFYLWKHLLDPRFQETLLLENSNEKNECTILNLICILHCTALHCFHSVLSFFVTSFRCLNQLRDKNKNQQVFRRSLEALVDWELSPPTPVPLVHYFSTLLHPISTILSSSLILIQSNLVTQIK